MNTSPDVWIIDDDQSIRWVLEKALTRAGISCTCYASAQEALDQLGASRPAAVISDIRMPGMDGFEFLETVRTQHPELPVIIMTAHSDLESAVNSYRGGAFEYLPKPFDIDEAIGLVRRALQHTQERVTRNGGNVQQPESPDIIGEAAAMQEVFRAIGRLAHSNITVLINGESGTGKELVAHALHRHSPRAEFPFIALNMAAIPRDLIESELFGHEKGAFTGATQQRTGRFEQADGGTLFLDEIGDMPADAQTRLLRVLADGEFYRIGAHTARRADVRIIAATHQNLEELVRAGKFREDLFHRLNVIRVHVPPLRERREDIPVLADHFLRRAASELKTERKQLQPEAAAVLRAAPWPGNVRQLENTCRWITVMASGREVQVGDLPPELLQEVEENQGTAGSWEAQLRKWVEQELQVGSSRILDTAMPRFESILIEAALRHTAGRRKDAAELLGWGRNTLTRKIKELALDAAEDSDEGEAL